VCVMVCDKFALALDMCQISSWKEVDMVLPSSLHSAFLAPGTIHTHTHTCMHAHTHTQTCLQSLHERCCSSKVEDDFRFARRLSNSLNLHYPVWTGVDIHEALQ